MRFGIDNVLISRIRSLSPSFPKRVLSSREYGSYLKSGDRDSFLAGRFAAKEAYVKASGRLGIKYSLVEVLNDDTGKPALFVEGKRTGQVTITHDFVATALVVLDD